MVEMKKVFKAIGAGVVGAGIISAGALGGGFVHTNKTVADAKLEAVKEFKDSAEYENALAEAFNEGASGVDITEDNIEAIKKASNSCQKPTPKKKSK